MNDWHAKGSRVFWGEDDFAGVTDVGNQERARLISAAPDLLDALKMFRSGKYDFQTWANMADAAIAKAEVRKCTAPPFIT